MNLDRIDNFIETSTQAESMGLAYFTCSTADGAAVAELVERWQSVVKEIRYLHDKLGDADDQFLGEAIINLYLMTSPPK